MTVGRLLGACVMSPLVAAGCGAGATGKDPRARGAFDLQCSDPIEVVALSETTRGVRGCGRQATYFHRCSKDTLGMIAQCTWVQDSAVTPNGSTIVSAGSR